MIKLPNDYESARAYDGTRAPTLTPGGHICRIRSAELTKARSSGADMLVVEFDINEGGEFNEYFAHRYEGRLRYNQNATWPGTYRTTIANAEGKTNTRFKGLIQAIEQSNAGYRFTGDERTLAGKLVGFNFGEEEYNENGDTTVRPQYAVSVARVREGVIPPAKRLFNPQGQGYRAPAPAQADNGGFTEVDMSDDLPF